MRSFFSLLGALLLIGCQTATTGNGKGAAQEFATVEGAAAYRERIAPPPGALLIVTASNISRADAAAVELARLEQDADAGAPPYAFSLSIPRDRLARGQRYNVRAAIYGAQGQLLWTTDQAYPINPALDAQDVGLLVMRRAGIVAHKRTVSPHPLAQWRPI